MPQRIAHSSTSNDERLLVRNHPIGCFVQTAESLTTFLPTAIVLVLDRSERYLPWANCSLSTHNQNRSAHSVNKSPDLYETASRGLGDEIRLMLKPTSLLSCAKYIAW